MINIYSYCDILPFRILLPYLTKFGFQILPEPFNQDFLSESRYPRYMILRLVNCMR